MFLLIFAKVIFIKYDNNKNKQYLDIKIRNINKNAITHIQKI